MMPPRNQQRGTGVNPPGRGPAQPKHVEDPHPADEEHYTRQRHPGSDTDKDKAAGNKRPSDTAGDSGR